MTIKDIMKYIESEYSIINSSTCEVCGGSYFVEELRIDVIGDIPYDVCDCVCSECGYEKTFEFCAPFTDEKDLKKAKKQTMN